MRSMNPSPLRLGVLGLEQRAINMFRLFLKGPCRDCAVIVDAGQKADAYLVDMDVRQGAEMLAEYRKEYPEAPFIVLSVKRYAAGEGLVFVQKPARTEAMQSAIAWAREMASAPRANGTKSDAGSQPAVAMKVIRADDRLSNGATRRVAMLMDEQSFRSYLGHRDDLDPNQPAQWGALFFDPARHLLADVGTAVRLAAEAGRPIRVETLWKPLYVLPEQRRIWINADEAQIRAACAILFQKTTSHGVADAAASTPEISEVQQADVDSMLESGKAMSIEACLWKMALWTSKGRLPTGFDPKQRVSLQRWPNFTRVMITPHAMRIAAHLWHKPGNLFDVASALGIRQQYVFAFFCAANALGLTHAWDATEVPEEVGEPPALSAPEKAQRTSLLGKILKRLKVI